MYADLLFEGLLRSSENILDGKDDRKINFLGGGYWSKKIIAFMEPSIADKNHCDI